MKVILKDTDRNRALAVVLAFVFVFSVVFACGCNLNKEDGKVDPTETADDPGTTIKTEGNPIVMKSPAKDLTLYDFRQSYYSNQYYMYMMYGMISPADYFDMVVDDLSNFLYIYNAAVDSGVDLDDTEKEALNENFDSQLEGIISQYASDVDESITDEAQRRSEAIKLLNRDLEADGLDYDTFITLSKDNLYMYTLADKYYTSLIDNTAITEDDVNAYINDKLASSSEMTMQSFKDEYEGYCSGSSAYPVYVPDDCFSVDHIFLLFETTVDENGSTVYLTDSRRETEEAIEGKLENTADYEAFMELEVEYGDDPGMDDEVYRENGYLIHPDFDSMYFTGFVYAAMNLYEEGWTPAADSETGEKYDLPELKFFHLNNGAPVVKVATEQGIHYIIINKTFTKGAVPYELGDVHWLSWQDAAKQQRFSDNYENMLTGWKEQFPVTVLTDVFRAEFVPADTGDGSGEG